MIGKNHITIKNKFTIGQAFSKQDKDKSAEYLKVAVDSMELDERDESKSKSHKKLSTISSGCHGAPSNRKLIDLPKDFTTSLSDSMSLTRAGSGTDTTACETVSTTSNYECDTVPLIDDIRAPTPPRRRSTQAKRRRFKLMQNARNLGKQEGNKKRDSNHKFVSCGSNDSEKNDEPDSNTDEKITKTTAVHDQQQNSNDPKKSERNRDEEVWEPQNAYLASESEDKCNEMVHTLRTSRRIGIPSGTLISSSQSSSFDTDEMDCSRHISLFDTLSYQSTDTRTNTSGRVDYEEDDDVDFDKMRLRTSQYQNASSSDLSSEDAVASFSTKKLHSSYEPSSLSRIGERLGGYQGSKQLYQASPPAQSTPSKNSLTSTHALRDSVEKLFSPKPTSDNDDVKMCCDSDLISKYSSSIMATLFTCGAHCGEIVVEEYTNCKS